MIPTSERVPYTLSTSKTWRTTIHYEEFLGNSYYKRPFSSSHLTLWKRLVASRLFLHGPVILSCSFAKFLLGLEVCARWGDASGWWGWPQGSSGQRWLHPTAAITWNKNKSVGISERKAFYRAPLPPEKNANKWWYLNEWRGNYSVKNRRICWW